MEYPEKTLGIQERATVGTLTRHYTRLGFSGKRYKCTTVTAYSNALTGRFLYTA